jgi:hypothetical protein
MGAIAKAGGYPANVRRACPRKPEKADGENGGPNYHRGKPFLWDDSSMFLMKRVLVMTVMVLVASHKSN